MDHHGNQEQYKGGSLIPPSYIKRFSIRPIHFQISYDYKLRCLQLSFQNKSLIAIYCYSQYMLVEYIFEILKNYLKMYQNRLLIEELLEVNLHLEKKEFSPAARPVQPSSGRCEKFGCTEQ